MLVNYNPFKQTYIETQNGILNLETKTFVVHKIEYDIQTSFAISHDDLRNCKHNKIEHIMIKHYTREGNFIYKNNIDIWNENVHTKLENGWYTIIPVKNLSLIAKEIHNGSQTKYKIQ